MQELLRKKCVMQVLLRTTFENGNSDWRVWKMDFVDFLIVVLCFCFFFGGDERGPEISRFFFNAEIARAEMFNAAIASCELRASIRESRVWKMFFF